MDKLEQRVKDRKKRARKAIRVIAKSFGEEGFLAHNYGEGDFGQVGPFEVHATYAAVLPPGPAVHAAFREARRRALDEGSGKIPVGVVLYYNHQPKIGKELVACLPLRALLRITKAAEQLIREEKTAGGSFKGRTPA